MDQPPYTRPSLPSISSLIEAVDEQKEPNTNDRSPKANHDRRRSGGSQGQLANSPDRPSLAGSPRNYPPPTPELPPTSSFDFHRQSDGNQSPTSSRPGYQPPTPTSTNPDLYVQRSSYPPIPEPNSSYPPIPDANQWSANQQNRSPTDNSAQDPSRPPQVDSKLENGQYQGLAQQKPLPAAFPPPIPGQHLPPIDPQMAPTWQHHHYYPPANPPSYPQTQERYVCSTCSKPFSRPSSLKIHTYSHTGEKPFTCKHEGCGKHFSVRSNMKRHEKGCHGGGDGSSVAANSPKSNSQASPSRPP